MPPERVWHRRDGREVVWYRETGDDDEGLRNAVVLVLILAAAATGALVALFFAQRAHQPDETVLYLLGLGLAAYVLVVLGSLVSALMTISLVVAIARAVGGKRKNRPEVSSPHDSQNLADMRNAVARRNGRYQLRVVAILLAAVMAGGVLFDIGYPTASLALVVVAFLIAPVAVVCSVVAAARRER